MNTINLLESSASSEHPSNGLFLKALALCGVLSLLPQQGSAQNTGGMNEGDLSTEVTTPKVDEKKGLAIDWGTATRGVAVKTGDEGVSQCDEDEKEPGITGGNGDKEIKEKAELSANFSRQTGVGYSVNGGDALWVNRFIGSGKLFKGKLGEISVLGIADLDDPLNSKGSGKLLLGKKLYKGLSLDGDYTFSGTGNNVFRFGLGYGGKLGDGSYGVKIFPLNTNGSPIAAKVSLSTKVGKSGSLSSFVSVDFDTMGYYGEAEYTHQLAKGVAAFVQARLMGTMDGEFTSTDKQIFMGGVKFSL